jgi:hypothetical protein
VSKIRSTAGQRRWALPAAVVIATVGATLMSGVGAASAAQHQAREVPGKAPISGEPLKGPATQVPLASNCGVTMYRGNLYIADGIAVRRVNSADYLTSPLATISNQGYTCGLSFDRWGNLVFANSNDYTIQVLAEKTGTFYGQSMTAGQVYTVAGTGTEGTSASGGVATQTDLGSPYDVVPDRYGNLVFTDSGFKGSTKRYGSVVQVLAEKTGSFYHQKMTAGDLYTVAGEWGNDGDTGIGGRATKAALGKNLGDLALDTSGNIVIAAFENDRVEVVAEKTGTFYGQAMTRGDLYSVAGTGTPGYSGDGGPAASAEFNEPWGVAIDGSGNLVITDFYNSRVRVVAATSGTFYGQPMTAGDVYTIIGTGVTGYSGDGGPAIDAEINWPIAVSVDSTGGLLLDDYGNDRDRYVPATSGTFFGQSMTAGSIYTVAGNGQYQN